VVAIELGRIIPPPGRMPVYGGSPQVEVALTNRERGMQAVGPASSGMYRSPPRSRAAV
jgi:hypothetical protein